MRRANAPPGRRRSSLSALWEPSAVPGFPEDEPSSDSTCTERRFHAGGGHGDAIARDPRPPHPRWVFTRYPVCSFLVVPIIFAGTRRQKTIVSPYCTYPRRLGCESCSTTLLIYRAMLEKKKYYATCSLHNMLNCCYYLYYYGGP